MLRARAKQGLCRGLAALGLDRRIGWLLGSARKPWVAGYHQVVEDGAAVGEAMPGLPISMRTLRRHLEWIARRFEVISLDDLDAWSRRPARARPLAAITFDDGYRGVYEFAFPLLRRMGIPASVFVVSDLVGGSELLHHDRVFAVFKARLGSARAAYAATRALLRRSSPAAAGSLLRFLAEAPPPRAGPQRLLPLTWGMLTQMHASGLTIGSHTRTHPLLVGLEPRRLDDELRGSRQLLADHLGAPVDQFAYPDGQFDHGVVQAVADAGYQLAVTTCQHRDPRSPLLTLPRTMLWEDSSIDGAGEFSPAIMSCQSQGVFELVRRCRLEHAHV